MDIQELWDKYYELNDSEDYDGAKKCLQTMVGNGVFDALSLIGDMYAKGEGVEQNYDKALEYYNLALEHGCVKANCHIAHLYYYGLGVKQDYKKAFELYKIVAENDISLGYYKMAYMYLNGEGVNVDFKKARENALIASEKGSKRANKLITILDGLELAVKHGMASCSLFQRELCISFPRACEILDWLKEKGYVNKDKTTLLSEEEYENLLNGN